MRRNRRTTKRWGVESIGRHKYVLANWKMHQGQAAARHWVEVVTKGLKEASYVDPVVMPPFTALAVVADALHGTALGLGAQDVYPQPEGSVTGEIGTSLLTDLGVRYVLIGHSERRRLLGEDDVVVARKVAQALAVGMTPVVCVGEDATERGEGRTDGVIRRQTAGAVESVAASSLVRIMWAYEPVWAVGTDEPATPSQAAEAAATLRSVLRSRFGEEAQAANCHVLYGGSVDVGNIASFAHSPGLDGVLVGRSSLDPERFSRMVDAVGS